MNSGLNNFDSFIKINFQQTLDDINNVVHSTHNQIDSKRRDVNEIGRKYLIILPDDQTGISNNEKNESTPKEINRFIKKFLKENKDQLTKQDLLIIDWYLSTHVKKLKPNFFMNFLGKFFKRVNSDYKDSLQIRNDVTNLKISLERAGKPNKKVEFSNQTEVNVYHPYSHALSDDGFLKKNEGLSTDNPSFLSFDEERHLQEGLSVQEMTHLFIKNLVEESKIPPKQKRVKFIFEMVFFQNSQLYIDDLEKNRTTTDVVLNQLYKAITENIDQINKENEADFINYKEELMKNDPDLTEYAAKIQARVTHPKIDNLLNDGKDALSKLWEKNHPFYQELVHYFSQFKDPAILASEVVIEKKINELEEPQKKLKAILAEKNSSDIKLTPNFTEGIYQICDGLIKQDVLIKPEVKKRFHLIFSEKLSNLLDNQANTIKSLSGLENKTEELLKACGKINQELPLLLDECLEQYEELYKVEDLALNEYVMSLATCLPFVLFPLGINESTALFQYFERFNTNPLSEENI